MGDLDSDLKKVVIIGFEHIPAVGELLATITDLLWPEGHEDPWEAIKERAEALINQKLDEDAYQRVQASLTGIKDNLDDYVAMMKSDSPPLHKYVSYSNLATTFTEERPHFQEQTHQRVLLPLFAQFANLHLLLLRDAFQHGADVFGLTASEVAHIRSQLKAAVSTYIAYANSTVDLGQTTKFADLDLTSSYVRNMVLTVIDYVSLWTYFDPDTPAPGGVPLPREIFTDRVGVPNPVGTAGGGRGYYPAPPPGPITRVHVRAGSALDSIQVWYGSTPTQAMGGSGGYADTDIDLTHKAITTIVGYFFNEVEGLQLTFDDKSVADMGNTSGQFAAVRIDVPDDHYVSSINVISRFQDSSRGWLYNDLVRTVYFGLKLKPEALGLG